MRTPTRVVAGFNAVFQCLVGATAVAAPMVVTGSFGVHAAPSTIFLAVMRMFGGLLLASGLLSGFIASKKTSDVMLNRVYAAGLVGNVLADVVILATGELGFAQLAVGMGIEVVLAGLLLTDK